MPAWRAIGGRTAGAFGTESHFVRDSAMERRRRTVYRNGEHRWQGLLLSTAPWSSAHPKSGFDDNTNITTNLVKDLALIKSKLKYTNQFVETDIKEQDGTILKGFSTGGYTGTGATDEIKGYVHGNEWVVNSAQVNAIGGPDAVKNMVQKEIIQKNTKIQTTKLEYSNNKSDIIDKVMTGQDIIINGFNAILSKIDEIIDYNEERREQKHSVLVSGTVNIGG
jgi:hypothetical protein